MTPINKTGPLILGSAGRIGTMFRKLWQEGLWPSSDRPLWHSRVAGADLQWDMTGPAPVFPRPNGIIVLAGATTGDADELAANTRVALAALDLAAERDLGPVLLCSSSAVYGRAKGPQSEIAPTTPANAYGGAKLAMETAAAGHKHPSCAMRIANVAGADMALLNAAKGPISLDQFADGQSPRRMYVGPRSLARVMLALIARPEPLPECINLAAPGVLPMSDLLDAAGASYSWRPAPDGALPELHLDIALMQSLAPLEPLDGTAKNLVAEAISGGWSLSS